VILGTPLSSGTVDVPPFNREALIAALRIDQAGKSTFPEFLEASWRAGVVRYDVGVMARKVAYYGWQRRGIYRRLSSSRRDVTSIRYHQRIKGAQR